MYRVYLITHGQRKMFDHCLQIMITSSQFYLKLYIEGLSISITFAFFLSLVLTFQHCL